MMKICYWTPNAGGGAGKYEYYIPREMEKFGIEVKVFRKPSGFKGNPLTLRLFYKSDGDIVHATTQTLVIYSYPKPKRFVVTLHDIFPPRKNFELKLKQFLSLPKLKRADKIIAVSNFTKSEIIGRTKIDEDKIAVIPLGVDLSIYKPMNKAVCKREFGLNAEEKHILVVSSNAPHKRMDIVKAVFEEVRRRRENVKLVKAGYGQSLQGRDIINVGYIPEEKMPILYNACDVLLHTSEYEGFGMPLLEAMACGLPIVASNKASIPEVVGECGRLVNLESGDCVEEFVDNILDCIDKKERNEKGIERSKKFSWEIVAKDTMKVYEELLYKG
ncbi:MAG: glycosyltransferase family 1 protein [Nitrososphaerota archaeon]|nr:glycosyltransferase family 1 protein [Nitrososphaerota archaeon]